MTSVVFPAPAPSALPASEFDGRMLGLERQALDEAYREQVQALFASWMKDSAGQPARALTGMTRARRAYIDSMAALAQREGELRARGGL